MTVRVAVLLLCALSLLFVGAYHTVAGLVREENERHSKTIVGILTDTVVNAAARSDVPVDPELRDTIIGYEDYICTWYRVESVYMYVPNPEDGTIRYLAASHKTGDADEAHVEHMTDVTTEYVLSPEELAVWNGEETFAVMETGFSENTVDTIMLLTDPYGNRYMAGVAVSADEIGQEIRRAFIKIALIILLVMLVTILLMRFLVVKKVSRPAERISRSMTEFIRDGKRSNVRLEEKGSDEFAMIARAFNSMTGDIDSYLEDIGTLSRAQERQKTELEIAESIQRGFLPDERISLKNCEINAFMQPAKNIGGDLYYYSALDDERVLVAVGDVSGKGIAASMCMAVTFTLIHQFAKMGKGPAEILQSVNDTLSERNPRMLFVTIFIGIYDRNTETLTYANAGHNPPYLLGTTPRFLEGAQNSLIGIFENEAFVEETVRLEMGDLLFMYTDGITEAVDAQHRFFGTERLAAALNASHKATCVDSVLKAVRKFTGETEQFDDITMLSLALKEERELLLDVDVKAFSDIREAILSTRLPRALQLDLCLTAEECFVNICSYAYENGIPAGEKISFRMDCSDRVVMRFIDGGIPYDPRQDVISPEDYNMDEQIGGLGKVIMFSLADAIDYEYKDGKNILTITKRIREETA